MAILSRVVNIFITLFVWLQHSSELLGRRHWEEWRASSWGHWLCYHCSQLHQVAYPVVCSARVFS